ncbi:hypothetical protein SSS_01095 [Sarcoptes scabiei]|uniref:Uncharacterized protein n=1 Tax=Sarcoptes scabiei TaxID=52283 RepID=A0A834VBR4_SARSC|nr:hypothetical protein SSS_01095 [Sarcoptes scabiei]
MEMSKSFEKRSKSNGKDSNRNDCLAWKQSDSSNHAKSQNNPIYNEDVEGGGGERRPKQSDLNELVQALMNVLETDSNRTDFSPNRNVRLERKHNPSSRRMDRESLNVFGKRTNLLRSPFRSEKSLFHGHTRRRTRINDCDLIRKSFRINAKNLEDNSCARIRNSLSESIRREQTKILDKIQSLREMLSKIIKQD